MIPINVTFHAKHPLDAERALHDLERVIAEEPSINRVQRSHDSRHIRHDQPGYERDAPILAVYIGSEWERGHFIQSLLTFCRRREHIVLELEYDGNKIRVDPLSLDRIDKDIRRLTEGSFSIGKTVSGAANNAVIGSNNTVGPSKPWPRR
jgi:hypothetical protein